MQKHRENFWKIPQRGYHHIQLYFQFDHSLLSTFLSTILHNEPLKKKTEPDQKVKSFFYFDNMRN